MQDAALARNARRKGNQRMPEEVIRHMAQRLEAPDCQRYEWERNTVTLPSENLPSLDDPQVQKCCRSCEDSPELAQQSSGAEF